jgi:8-oxo-dGTP diphosphatase
MIDENTFKKVDFNGSKGIVFVADKMLVYRRDDKTTNFPLCIDLPGGGREGNETPLETFQREVKEEFGINIKKDDIEFSCSVPSVMQPQKKSFFMVTKKLQLKPEDVIFGDEGVEWMLMTTEEYIHRPDGIERQQKRVEKYLAGELVSC